VGRAPVSESTLTSHIKAARAAIGDNGEDQSLIKTLPRRGFRSVGTVVEADGSSERPGLPPLPWR
jgi:DNA-binding winged helix-turn-helix (wHTH) protein